MGSLCSELRMESWRKQFEGLSRRENEPIDGDREEVRQDGGWRMSFSLSSWLKELIWYY